MTLLSITYGYARVSKADDDAKNLHTQLRLLAHHGIRKYLIFTESLPRPWACAHVAGEW